MNHKDFVSPSQMALLLLAFTLGSSIVFIPNPVIHAASNSAWISVVISGTAGIPGLLSVLYLYRIYPDKSSIQYLGDIFGKWIGTVFAVLMLLAIVRMTANIVIGVGAFFTTTMMLGTPLYEFHVLILLVAALTALAGIEVTARLFNLFLLVMLATIILILLFGMGNYHPANLLPQFTGGISPILHGAIINFGFPYSEIFTFSILLYFVRPARNEPLGRLLFSVYALNMLIFIMVVLCATMTFGSGAGHRNFTLYVMARVTHISGFVERSDAIAGITLIAGSYIKATIALISLSSGIAHLLKLKDSRSVILPLVLLLLFMSLTTYSTQMESSITWYLIVPAINMCATIPIILAAVTTMIKRGFRKEGKLNTAEE
ncbi:GerAB/ArcD/ProY family transporter [Paenibacillus sepulcri]|uniref:Spore germination protein n=1 Tax=Paenibacillus sepulcri TaxID=359917 RepID=A0ABS7C959_9BACL|nr:spore germination protein [Paenibacillus sepulcri]